MFALERIRIESYLKWLKMKASSVFPKNENLITFLNGNGKKDGRKFE